MSKRRVSGKELIAGRIATAVGYSNLAELKRIAKRLRKNPMGTSWDSIEGRKTVVGVQGNRLLVQVEGRGNICGLIDPAQLSKEIALDTRQLVSRNEASGQAAQRQAQEAMAQAEAAQCDGFTDGMTAKQAGLAIKVLNTQRSVSGVIKTAKQHVRDLAAKGYTVTANGDLAGPNGSFYSQKDLGKTLISYAAHLTTKRNPTPLMRKLRAKARAWIQQGGSWQIALNKASRMERDHNFRLGRLIRRILYQIRDEEAVKPGKQQSAQIIRKKKTVRTTEAMYRRLLDEYGVVDAQAARGFILDDGQCLNLGRHDDHRIINSVYADTEAAEERFGSRYGAFANLCRKFCMIRWIPESKMAEVFVPTTRSQDRVLMDLADAGHLREVEVHKPRGGTVMLEAEDGETLVRGINAVLG